MKFAILALAILPHLAQAAVLRCQATNANRRAVTVENWNNGANDQGLVLTAVLSVRGHSRQVIVQQPMRIPAENESFTVLKRAGWLEKDPSRVEFSYDAVEGTGRFQITQYTGFGTGKVDYTADLPLECRYGN